MKKGKRGNRKQEFVPENIKSAKPEQQQLPVEQQLFHEWSESREKIEIQVAEKLEYQYSHEGLKRQLVQALAFWNFFVNRIASCCSVDQRRKFLALIDPGDNMLLQIVVQVEMLPMAVFRRILWKHNIDFMSLESFLRRLTDEQIGQIEKNFSDLFHVGIVPRVFGKIERFFGRITPEKLLTAVEDKYKRYDRKAAWSYNLLGLDFGFNAYPGGISNDEKVIEVSPLRFLSKKNHADDFSVDQEKGKYWWFYRNARSNYIYKPNKYVELNARMCPGFWWTFIVHLFFWVVSPILSLVLCIAIYNDSFSHTPLGVTLLIAIAIPSLFTPTWSFCAVVKFAYRNLLSEKMQERTDNTAEFITKGFYIAAVVVICCAVIYAISSALHEIYTYLYPSFGMIGSIGIIAGVIYYIAILVLCEFDIPWSPTEENIAYWLPMTIFVSGVLAKAIILYGNSILQWCFRVALGLWFLLTSLGLVSAIFIIPLGIMFLAYCANTSWSREQQDRFFAFFDKLLAWVIIPLMFISIAVAGIYMHSIEMVIALLMAAILFGSAWRVVYIMTPEVYNARMLAVKVNQDRRSGFFDHLDYKLLLKNKWFQSLDASEQLYVMRKLSNIVRNSFSSGTHQIGYDLIIPNISMELLSVLYENVWMLRNNGILFKRFFIQELINGKSSNEAAGIAHEKWEQHEIENEKRKNVFMKPFRYVAGKIGAFFGKIAEIFVTFKRLYELFNERCPYVTERGVVKTNIDA